eukprot:247914-Amphidinium_carterae.1
MASGFRPISSYELQTAIPTPARCVRQCVHTLGLCCIVPKSQNHLGPFFWTRNAQTQHSGASEFSDPARQMRMHRELQRHQVRANACLSVLRMHTFADSATCCRCAWLAGGVTSEASWRWPRYAWMSVSRPKSVEGNLSVARVLAAVVLGSVVPISLPSEAHQHSGPHPHQGIVQTTQPNWQVPTSGLAGEAHGHRHTELFMSGLSTSFGL